MAQIFSRGKYLFEYKRIDVYRSLGLYHDIVKNSVPNETPSVQEDFLKDLKFDDYNRAFKSLSRWELARSIGIIKLCTNDVFVDHSLKLMNTGRKILGRGLFDRVAKQTIYGQFVGGDSPETLQVAVSRMRDNGIGAILAVAMEEDVTDDTKNANEKYDQNLSMTLEGLKVMSELNDPHPMMQVKLTAILPAKLCETISEHVPHPSKTGHVVESIAHAILDDSETTLEFLSKEETSQLRLGLSRIKRICEAAVEDNVIIMIDGEYTYLNPALNLFSLAMMLVFNSKKTLVYYTYQNYLKDMADYMKTDMSYIASHGVGFGTKLVRGAYIDKERRLAREGGYADPVNQTYEATSDTYHNSLDTILRSIAKNPSKYSAVIASHNENTASNAVHGISQLQIDPSCGSVFFAQLYGMCDHITFTLSELGMPVYKSIPYGSVEDTLAYLSRRAMENRSVLERAKKEKTLMWKALKERKFQSI